MAKNDNLQDFLTDVANAIRNKKGTSDLINPQNFSSEIESIESNSFNVELFYGFWQLKKDNQTYVIKVYDTGKLDYEIYASSPTKYTDISYTIINDTIEFQFVSGGSADNIEITVKTFKYENGTLIDINTNDIYSHILFSDGTLSVTENGSYGSTDSNGFNMVEVNVQGGDYDINAVYNDDGTQSLAIVDSDFSIDRNAEIKQLKEVIKRLIERKESNVTLPDNLVTVIGSYSFYKWNNLNRIVIPEGVVTIESSAFYNCALSSVIFKQNSMLSRLEGGAFYSNKNLKKITLPSKLSYIGGNAFYGCSSLTEITILATTPPTLSNTNAISTATTTIHIPKGTLSAYQTATNWSSFASKFVELEV